MKKITLTPKEFYLFKKIADFWYSFSVTYNYNILIEADAHLLEELGY
jgi:hypothetical protein